MLLGHLRHHQRAQSHPQRLGGLPDPHRQPAPFGREPAHHQPSTGRITARRGHPAQKEEHRYPQQRVRQRRRQCRGRGQRRSGPQHETLARPVHHVPPGDERGHHAELRHRRDQAGAGQVQAETGVQRRDEKCDAVDENIGEQGGEQSDGQHRPPALRHTAR